MKIKSIWDNLRESLDRYTIIFDDREGTYLGLSSDPSSMYGYSQFGHGMMEGEHLGEPIEWEELPSNVQKHIEERMGDMIK